MAVFRAKEAFHLIMNSVCTMQARIQDFEMGGEFL